MAIAYLKAIAAEKAPELASQTTSLGRSTTVDAFLNHVVENLETQIYVSEPITPPVPLPPEIPQPDKTEEQAPRDRIGVVGARIDLPVLNYAPLNEMGVILLFGYYMQDLGFSHVEEIRPTFPDAVAMQRLDAKRFKRVRIEFEYRASSFKIHGHSAAGCDMIVCWENDWPDCPLDVIELKSVLFED